MAEQVKIKAYRPSRPTEFRYFTKEAFDYIKGDSQKPSWVAADDQPVAVQEKKAQAAAPVEDRKVELQAKYKEIVGDNVAPEFESWNSARLHIEIVKAQTKQKAEEEAKTTESFDEAAESQDFQTEVNEVVTEAVTDKPKTKKAKKPANAG